jgi:hypothetical protein
VKGGLSEDQVHDAVRVAATIQAAAISLEIGEITDVLEHVQSQSAGV